MKAKIRKGLNVLVCFSLLSGVNYSSGAVPAPSPAAQSSPSSSAPIEELLKRPYLELLQQASSLRFTAAQFQQARERLKKEEKAKRDELKRKQDGLEKQVTQAQAELKKLSEKTSQEAAEITSRRHDLHCQIQSFQAQLADTKIALQSGVPIEYENLQAKLELLEKWPTARQQILRQMDSGQARTRRWADVEDIGFRTIEPNQEDDIKKGQEAVQEMKQLGLLPKELEDPEITEYVNRIAQNIAKNSDLKVPLRMTLLNSKEVNAFALPGGFLFINRGLIEEAENEAQLAGVIAHEIAHDTARHANKLMKRATIASLIYQAAQIGAMIFTGGVVGIGTYYALQYGFQGLGLVLSLQLLGVSRDYELEADQLGAQYVWKAGYNPEGFIEFFDIMASKEGYVEKTSFFRTHPAFYDRIVGVFREISFLPKQEQLIENTREFEAMKAQLKKIAEDLDKEEKDRPTLMRREPGCPEALPGPEALSGRTAEATAPAVHIGASLQSEPRE